MQGKGGTVGKNKREWERERGSRGKRADRQRYWDVDGQRQSVRRTLWRRRWLELKV